MSELLVPVIDGKVGQVALHKITAEENSCGLTIYDDNGDLIKSSFLQDKIQKTFNELPSMEVRFYDYCNLNSCIAVTESTQSITLGFLCEIYRVLKNRNFQEKWNYIVVTGDVKENTLESVTGIKKKFEGVTELSKKENKKILFIYVNDNPILKEGLYDENIQILRFSSKDKLEELFYYLFDNPLTDEQNLILQKIIIDKSNEFVETEKYIELRKEIISSDPKYQGYLLGGKSNSGKSVIAYNLCLELMRRDTIYAPIWITLNNNELPKILKIDDKNEEIQNKKTQNDKLFEHLCGEIKNRCISPDKKYVLVIDNLELSYVDEILNVIPKIKNECQNIIFSIITSWSLPSQDEKVKELNFKQVELTEVNFSDFSGILNSVIQSQFTSKLQSLTSDEKNQLTQASYDVLKDCPGDLALTLSSIKDISVEKIIEKLNSTSIDSNSKKNYFYNLSFERLGLFSQIVLFQFIEKFGCDVCNFSDLKDLEVEIRNQDIINSSYLSLEAIEKAIKQLANNYIIQSNSNNEYSIKNSVLKYFLFSCKENKSAWNLSERFIDKNKKMHLSIDYNWVEEFEYIVENNISLHADCLYELARNSNNTKMLDVLFKHSDVDINTADERGWTALHLAAQYNKNLEIFKYLIEKGADFHLETKYKKNILHFAVINPNISILEYILNEHLYDDINGKACDGVTPLMAALEFVTKSKFLELLINHKASYKETDNNGGTVLHYASRNEHIDIIKFVIKNKLYKNINALDNENQNALFWAVYYNSNISVIQELISNDCKTDLINKDGDTLLHIAIYNKNSNIIKYLLEKHYYEDIDAKNEILGFTPLHKACLYCSNTEIISTLIENGASKAQIAKSGESIYHSLMINPNEKVVDYVLEHYPIDTNDSNDYFGESLVHYAVEYNSNVEVLKILRKKKFDFSEVSNSGQTILHFAAHNKNTKILDYILKHHIYKDINEKDNDGWTALHYAAFYNPNSEIIDLLLKCGANYKLRTDKGESVLLLASNNNGVEIVNYILQKKLYEDINEVDNYGWTAFLICARFNNEEVLNFLYENGLDWKKKSNYGDSCFTVAAWNEDLSVIKFIYDYGLYEDVNETDNDGWTALQNAIRGNKNIDIIKYLLKIGVGIDNKTNKYRYTFLHCAMANENSEIIKYVVEYIIKHNRKNAINELDCDGNNALIIQIIHNGKLEVFKLLEKAGCKTDIHNKLGRNLLHIAVMEKRTEIIDYLLKKNICNVNEQDSEGNFPLSLAIAGAKSLDYVKLLIEHGADYKQKTKDGFSLLMVACENECVDIVEHILKNKYYIDINEKDKYGWTVLHIAADQNKDIQILELLYKYNCDFKRLTNDGNSLIHFASTNDNSNVLEYVLSKLFFKDIDKKNVAGETALFKALNFSESTDNIKQLVAAGANLSDITNDNSTMLHAAAYNKFDERMVKLLVEELNFEDVDAKNDNGNTALHIAAIRNNIPTFKYLTLLGLNPRELNYDGKSPLDLLSLENKGPMDEFIKTLFY